MFSLFNRFGKAKDRPTSTDIAPGTAATPAAAATLEPSTAPAAVTPAPTTETSLDIGALLAPPPAAAPSQPAVGPADPARTEALKPTIVAAISTVFDPEIPVNIYELGLIYDIAVDAQDRVQVQMTLTSPACPSAQQLPSEVRYKIKALPGVSECAVEIVWEPPWTKELMSEEAKLSLGLF